MYKSEILADSVNEYGNRLTTFKITFPRMVLAEFNTHRMFSRNSASSRAIPFKKMVKMVEENPFVPIAWQKDHKGMQGTEYLTDDLSIQFAKSNWLTSRDWAIKSATALNSADNGYESVTKQLCNRLLEPFMWHTVIVTATEFDNFFELRCPKYYDGKTTHKSIKDYLKINNADITKYPKDYWKNVNNSQADIHIQAIAELMWDSYNESTPKQLKSGEWHKPYGDVFHWDEILRSGIDETDYDLLLKVSVARCARISYETLGDNPKIDYVKDIELHDTLLISRHMSPFEHVAMASDNEMYANFNGFQSYRYQIENG